MKEEPRTVELPPIICVVGRKDSGKTTVVVELVAELTRRGRRVMTAKHGHHFELDAPGTDSYRHRHEGGAGRVALVGPDAMAVMGAWGPDGEPGLREVVRRYLADAEIVVAEGWKGAREAKIEVHRAARHPRPLVRSGGEAVEHFVALVTDGPTVDVDLPVFELDDPARATRLADFVERALLE